MGLPRAAVNLLLHVAAHSPMSGRIATLGRQHVYLTADEVRRMAAAAGVSISGGETTLHRNPVLQQQGFISDDSLYNIIGFSESVRVDHSDYEDAEERLDLNDSRTPAHLCNAFDVVLDSGTVEHIFDLRNAVSHCLRMCKPDGRIIHLTPSSNSVNHGFYSVSPTLYADFYATSGCEIEMLYLCRMPQDFERGVWHVYDCLQTDRNWLPLGRLDGAIWFTFAVIRKRNGASPTLPQQSFYVSTWKKSAEDCPDHVPTSGLLDDEPVNSRAGRLLAATRRIPAIHRMAGKLIVQWRRWINARREKKRGRIPFPYVGAF